MKQTAVEWYAEQEEKLILEFISKKINDVEYGLYRLELLNKAKEIEKQQISEAYEDGYSDSDTTFELNKEYYNEQFKNK